MNLTARLTKVPSLFCLIASSVFLCSSSLHAAVRFSLGGSQSSSNLGWQSVNSTSISGGVSMDLSEYFRLGYNHRQEISTAEGLKCSKTTTCVDDDYTTAFKTDSHIVANSVDLTLILYAGEVFTPFIFAGVTKKSYDITTYEDGKEPEHDSGGPLGPSGGLGLSLAMTQKFSLTLKHSLSQGGKYAHGEEPQATVDRQSEIGISYKL